MGYEIWQFISGLEICCRVRYGPGRGSHQEKIVIVRFCAASRDIGKPEERISAGRDGEETAT